MKNYIQHHEWSIVEEGFVPDYNEISESLFSIGNGHMGQRANFEEAYSGKSLRGSYVAGVYYPDKTRVGWWKNGYPEYFAKVLNAANWIGIDVYLDDTAVDLAQCEIHTFRRELDMRRGVLHRLAEITLPTGQRLRLDATRFCSMATPEAGAIRYRVTMLAGSGTLRLLPYVCGDVMNRDANYGDRFWDMMAQDLRDDVAYIQMRTKKTDFVVTTAMTSTVTLNGVPTSDGVAARCGAFRVQHEYQLPLQTGDVATVYKYAANVSSLHYADDTAVPHAIAVVQSCKMQGFDELERQQQASWAELWSHSDITIQGDVAAQQAIRYNIFQLHQTYSGKDERLNIGPKGFTGEKYGGSTYWDTEAYCLPFYLATADQQVARNLLVYRYKHLQRAIENAQKLGFSGGAALYPMVTMNGEECHNEWEITFEEIHRNGAIAYAIYDYINYTDDHDYLAEYGLEVLIGIARFWAQRVNWSADKQRYVILGVTGPNEYENNINNNWYTNYIASWCLQYAQQALDYVQQNQPARYQSIVATTNFQAEAERGRWNHIIACMYYPTDSKRGVFLQQDGFLDKELIPVSELPANQRPLNQKWSWDRILRSCYIKQADVLQGLYFFEPHFDLDTIRRNFDFYEPLTVHESSLSPCVHVILAALLGYQEKAYELYLRTARLDLDDYNNDTEDGLHITSMAGTWMSVVKGFGGMRVREGAVHFSPFLPARWEAFSFKVVFRGHVLHVTATREHTAIANQSDTSIVVYVLGTAYHISAGTTVNIPTQVSAAMAASAV